MNTPPPDPCIITMLRSPARLEPHTCNEAADEIERLRAERDAALLDAEALRPIASAQWNSYSLAGLYMAERDRARRLVCELQCDPPERFIGLPHEVAQMYGWDCYPEATP
jgi:hypothetical protein